MYVVADTERLLDDGVLTPAQAATLRARARETMMRLAVNVLLTGGILAATFGLIVWLADPLTVAVAGALTLAGGLLALARGGETIRFFGNAAALIGAGMLLGGAAVEMLNRDEAVAGPVLFGLGAAVATGFGLAFRRWPALRFACGAAGLMGVALHLAGLGVSMAHYAWADWSVALASLYAAAIIVAAGVATDIRFVTALAIVPFAQALSTGTTYWHAAYVFYSPEPTLSILQMSTLFAAGLWVAATRAPRWGRHGGILAIMAAIVANLCALVGSLFGDWVGQTLWGPGRSWWRQRDLYAEREDHAAAVEAFRETALHIPAGAYSILWALALAAVIVWAAHGARRGLFNTAVVFAGIHAYTQAFESFHDEPLAYVIGGLIAIPLAWGLWRLDRHWLARRTRMT